MKGERGKGKTPFDYGRFFADWAEKDYDFARERIDGKFDFDKIAEMLRYYETALTNWREVREQITHMLPKEKFLED